ncbi:uncharacterized protein [Miscanthus floridulus]|uniref:uncharacterized protein n=1 Tax=Miscanthus floridulus TaxID=154761 RepID=UPI003457AD02
MWLARENLLLFPGGAPAGGEVTGELSNHFGDLSDHFGGLSDHVGGLSDHFTGLNKLSVHSTGLGEGNAALIKHSGSKAHKAAQERYIGFINPKVAIDYHIDKWTDEELYLYKKRLTYSLRCIKFLLLQGLAFRGNDESEESSNRGNFIELLKFLVGNSDEVNKYVLNNAPVDESSDISHKEQLALYLRFVDKLGRPCEHFIGVVHVDDTTSLSLKEAIKGLLDSNGLIMTWIRGQGYDGASNMKVLVAVAKGNTDCKTFFDQRRDQDILNAISLVNVAKSRMQQLRSDGWDKFHKTVTSFCITHGVEVPTMDDAYVPYGKSTRHKVYDMVYSLLKLVLLLPVATVSVERDIFFQVDEDDIIETFMSLRKRRINK